MIESFEQVMSLRNFEEKGYAMMVKTVKREGVMIELLDETNYQQWKETATIILGLQKQWVYTEKNSEDGTKIRTQRSQNQGMKAGWK